MNTIWTLSPTYSNPGGLIPRQTNSGATPTLDEKGIFQKSPFQIVEKVSSSLQKDNALRLHRIHKDWYSLNE